MCVASCPILPVSTYPSGGGGGVVGDGGIFYVILCCSQLVLTELSFPSVILFVGYSLISSCINLNSFVEVQANYCNLDILLCGSDCSVFTEALFSRGVSPSFPG